MWERRKGIKMRLFSISVLTGLVCVFTPSILIAEEAHADITLPAVKTNIIQNRIALAESNPQAFFEFALKHYESNIRDYTCTFIKKEFVSGKYTKEQEIRVKFREGPFAVFMKWIKNAGLVDRVLYVKGHYDNKALVKPAGILGWFVPTYVKRPVNGPEAAKVSRKRIDQFGFANALKLILNVNRLAKKTGDLEFRFVGQSKLNGRKTLKFERFLPDKPNYPDQHLIVHIDQEWLIPVGIFCYNSRGKLLGKYLYKDIKLNRGLAWREFTPKANGM